MAFLIKLVLSIVVLAIAFAYLRTWQVENSENQKIFAANSAPARLDGFYQGSINLPVKVTWIGKKFNAASSTGINVFDNGSEGYPFRTSVGVIGSSTVLDINYDSPENPFWARYILDRVVETGPDHYLGKITVRLIPGHPFSLGFFRLEK